MNPLRDYRLTSRGGGALSDSRTVQEIVARVLDLRDGGVMISDADVLAQHPELAAELKTELLIAGQIRQAMLAARNLPAPNEPLLPPDRSLSVGTLPATPGDSIPSPSVSVKPKIAGHLLKGQIGHGGQAAVYEAIQESTGRRVAIKVIAGGAFVTTKNRARFEREARILAGLHHPNIVGIIEQGRTECGSFFAALDYVDGIPLDEYWSSLQPGESENLRQLIRVFAKIADAIDEAHAKKVIHRDIKPTNILVCARGEPHLLDFGLARAEETSFMSNAVSITAPHQILGSLPWASPEQVNGEARALDARSDIYSLGVLLYEAVAGVTPYPVKGAIDEVVKRIRTQVPIPASRHKTARPGVDGSLDAIILRCLEKTPDNRHQSAALLRDDLLAWLEGRKTSSPIAATRTRRLPMAIICTLLTMIGAVGAVRWYSERTPHMVVFQLPSLQSTIGLRLVKIPAGKYLRGSPETEAGRDPNENEHLAFVGLPFYIATTCVTQEQYTKVMGTNPSDTRFIGPTLPVQNVTWKDAVEFCRKLSAIEHLHYRLPTEAEWEFACRAGSTAPFPFPSNPGLTAFSSSNSGGVIHPVAQKLPNCWGLFDMQGNVRQWCNDIYSIDPEDTPRVRLVTARSIRGGSMMFDFQGCRAAARTAAAENFRSCELGFRVVCDP